MINPTCNYMIEFVGNTSSFCHFADDLRDWLDNVPACNVNGGEIIRVYKIDWENKQVNFEGSFKIEEKMPRRVWTLIPHA